MVAFSARVDNADRMMIRAHGRKDGIEFAFADGASGVIPFADLPEIGAADNIKDVRWPNPYEVVLETQSGETIEIPWDFARAYCDPSYRPRIERAAAEGRLAIGERIRQLRREANITQETLAASANIGRITLVRIEQGEQSPRHQTLLALAGALGIEPRELLVSTD